MWLVRCGLWGVVYMRHAQLMQVAARSARGYLCRQWKPQERTKILKYGPYATAALMLLFTLQMPFTHLCVSEGHTQLELQAVSVGHNACRRGRRGVQGWLQCLVTG